MSRYSDRTEAPRVRFDERTGLFLPDRRIIDPRGWGGAPPSRSYVAPAPPAGISVLQYNTSTSTNPTLPAHSTGNYILIAIGRAGSQTAPNVFTGFTDIDSSSGGSGGGDAAIRWMAKFAASGGETLAGGTAGVRKFMWILSGVNTSTPTGATGTQTANSATATYPSLTLTNANSFVFALLYSDVGSALPSDPSGMTKSGSATSGAGAAYWAGYIGPTSTFTSRTSTVTSDRWLTHNVEIIAA